MNTVTNIVNSFVLIPLAIVALSVRKISNSWLSPGAFFALIWFLFVSASIFLAPDFRPYPMGLWLLVMFTYAVAVGDVLSARFIIRSGLSSTNKKSQLPHVKTIFYITVLMVVITCAGLIWVSIYGFSRFLLEQNVWNLVLLPNMYASERYGVELNLPWTMRAVISLTYPASLIGGFTSYFISSKKKYVCYLPIVMSILYGSLFAVRSGVLLSFILAFSGLAVAHINFNGNLNAWFKRVAFNSSIFVVLLLALFMALQWLRTGTDEIFIFSELLTIAKAGILGSLSAFTHWLQVSDISTPALGINTFAAPFDWLGLTVRESGFYTDFTRIGSSHVNIYTFLRGLVQDFGLLGGAVFCLGLGSFGRITFEAVRGGRILWSVPLSAIYTFILFSPLISVFNTTSIVMTFVIFYILLIITLEPVS